MTDRDWEEFVDQTTIPWEVLDEEDFIEIYEEVIWDRLKAEDPSLERGVQPTVSLFNKVELGGRFISALKRQLDVTAKEFLVDIAELTERKQAHENTWSAVEKRTKEKCDEYIEHLRTKNSSIEKESTLDRIQSEIDQFLQAWRAVHGNDGVISTLENADEEETYSRLLEVYIQLTQRDITQDSLAKYAAQHKRFFDLLSNPKNPLEYNGIPEMQDQFGWERRRRTTSDLEADQIKSLWEPTETLAEQTAVLAITAIGLTTGECIEFHRNNINFPSENTEYDFAVVTFPDRDTKENPIPLIYGVETLKARIQQLEDKYGDEWNGYLFPNMDREPGHITGDMFRRKIFYPLIEESDIADDQRVRDVRKWHGDIFVRIFGDIDDEARPIAKVQGSTRGDTVKHNYLNNPKKVRYYRIRLRPMLGEVFADLDVSEEPIIYSDDFQKQTWETLAIGSEILDELSQTHTLSEYSAAD